ncbi:DUF3995 domain-containing protein [Fodinicola acaciae]|uniref:DUF3995 domain-containing protein n=1 Tax=Fodinicola acaciae TaxID=2681555 RepID=UPI0013D77917|nr:DUF3995 domain-containing protein [Fodinicola acaciae]
MEITGLRRFAAYAAAALALVYVAYKVWFAIDGRLGIPGGPPMYGQVALPQLGNASLGLLAATLAVATVSGWGRRIPRWLLAPACWLTAVMFCLGIVAVGMQLAGRPVTILSVLDIVVVVGLGTSFAATAVFYDGVRWPLVGWIAIAWTVGYGGLKLSWALGGDFLLAQAPLTGELRQMALEHQPGFALFGFWATVLLALVGIAVIVAVSYPAIHHLPRWMLAGCASVATSILLLRGILGAVSDVAHFGLVADPLEMSLLRWDFALWTPYFLVWGVLWALILRRSLMSAP